MRAPGVDQSQSRGSSVRTGRSLRISSITTTRSRTRPCGRSCGPKLSGQEEQLRVLAEMEAQHKVLLPQCEAIGRGFVSPGATATAEAGDELAGSLDELGIELGSHLEDEEQRCFPVIDQALTPEEFESFGKATAKAVGMRGSAKFFPWIFDTADPVERKAVLSMPPPPVQGPLPVHVGAALHPQGGEDLDWLSGSPRVPRCCCTSRTPLVGPRPAA